MKLTRGQMADMFAHAIIASAKVYGDDPIVAVTGDPTKPTARRSLAAACHAVRDRFRLKNKEAAAPVQISTGSLSGLISARYGLHDKANAAAVAAVARALAQIKPCDGQVSDADNEKPKPQLAGRPVTERQGAPAIIASVLSAPKPVAPQPVAPRPVAPKPAKPHDDGALSDRVYAHLTRPLSANSLASMLDVKELYVIAAMRELARQGHIVQIGGGNESTAKWQAA